MLGNTTFTDVSNMTYQSDDSFSSKFTARPNLDFSTASMMTPEQTALLRFKAAFQLYLKKEEVNYLFSYFLNTFLNF